MKSFLFSGKIALLHGVVLALVLVGTFYLFVRVGGHHTMQEIGVLRAYQGAELAEAIEALPPNLPLDASTVTALLEAAEQKHQVKIWLLPVEAPEPRGRFSRFHTAAVSTKTVRGRTCRLFGPPVFQTRVPIQRRGETRAILALSGGLHSLKAHRAFLMGLFQIGVLTVLGVTVLTLLLTAPLRKMSRSMDRIAAGDLDQRIRVRGRDEIASVGRSFNRMAERIQEMVNDQKELMAGVSHELRSPLTRMLVTIELLRTGGGDSDRLQDLATEIEVLDRLIEELILASRADLGKALLQSQTIDLNTLVQTSWKNSVALYGKVPPELRLELPHGADRIEAHPPLAARIFSNLFRNALYYGGGSSVTVSSIAHQGRVAIRVADGGPGVEENHLSKLFEPFYRADPSRSRETGASGLGLMIVRRAVEAHGGRVSASLPQEGGLAIDFDLPAELP